MSAKLLISTIQNIQFPTREEPRKWFSFLFDFFSSLLIIFVKKAVSNTIHKKKFCSDSVQQHMQCTEKNWEKLRQKILLSFVAFFYSFFFFVPYFFLSKNIWMFYVKAESLSLVYYDGRKDENLFWRKCGGKLSSSKIMISHKIQLWNFYAHTWVTDVYSIFAAVVISRMFLLRSFLCIFLYYCLFFSPSTTAVECFVGMLLHYWFRCYLAEKKYFLFLFLRESANVSIKKLTISEIKEERMKFFVVCLVTLVKDLFDTLCLRCHVNFSFYIRILFLKQERK